MLQEKLDNLNNPKKAGTESCSVCEELLIHLEQFFNMLEAARRLSASALLTVDDISKELKVSKSIVYRLIRHGEIEAVNIVETNGKLAKKGHYRIKRSSLDYYLDSKKVRPSPDKSTHKTYPRRAPKVKNHLGL